MRRHIKKFVDLCASSLSLIEPIYEFGALQVPGQEEYADLRPLFPGRTYIGTDMRPGTGVDRIMDLHELDLPGASVGTALLIDTLEHVEYPRTALENVHRVLKNDGFLVLSSVMNFPIHDYPHDYWRFTPEGFRSLLKPFSYVFVDSLGKPAFPHSVFGFACKGQPADSDIRLFSKKYKKLKHWWNNVEKKLEKTASGAGKKS